MEKWYAFYTRSRAEKKVYERLQEMDVTAFLPLITYERRWKDRKSKVEEPLFKSYLFAKFDYKFRFNIFPINGLIKIVNFKGEPAAIPDWQIESLKKIINNKNEFQLEKYIRQGALVKIMDGPLKDVIGTVKEIKGKSRLMISIDGVQQSLSVSVAAANVRQMDG
jgi:transcription antitermination factor NusG